MNDNVGVLMARSHDPVGARCRHPAAYHT